MATLVYEYGSVPRTGRDVIDQQMRLAHLYRNRLTELEHTRRHACVALQQQDPTADETELAEIVASIDAIETRLKLTSQRKQAKVKANVADKAELKRLRETMKEPLAKIQRQFLDQCSTVRREFSAQGLAWGTYQVVGEAFDRARTSRIKCRKCGIPTKSYQCCGETVVPWFVRAGTDGCVAIHFQNEGVRPTGLLHVENSWFWVDRVTPDPELSRRLTKRGRTTFHMRVCSLDKSPVWVTGRVSLHRPLPENGLITWVKLFRRRIGPDVEWRLQITVNTPVEERRPVGPDLAIDLGWRVRPNGLRVAYAVDGAGHGEELLLSEDLLRHFAKVRDLQAIRRQHFDHWRGKLAAWATKQAELPEWFSEAVKSIALWKSPARLATLLRHWRKQPFAGGEEMLCQLTGGTNRSWNTQSALPS